MNGSECKSLDPYFINAILALFGSGSAMLLTLQFFMKSTVTEDRRLDLFGCLVLRKLLLQNTLLPMNLNYIDSLRTVNKVYFASGRHPCAAFVYTLSAMSTVRAQYSFVYMFHLSRKSSMTVGPGHLTGRPYCKTKQSCRKTRKSLRYILT